MTSDGQPYGPVRYKEIVRDCYNICKNCNISYSEIMNITPIEKNYLIEFIYEESEQLKEKVKKRQQEIENRNNN